MSRTETVDQALRQSYDAAECVEGLVSMLISQVAEGDVEAATATRAALSASMGRMLTGLRMARRELGLDDHW